MRMEETKKSKEAAQKEAKVSEKTQAKCEENAKEESKKGTLAFQAAVQIRNAPQSPADFSPRRIPSSNVNFVVDNPPQSYIEQQQRGGCLLLPLSSSMIKSSFHSRSTSSASATRLAFCLEGGL